MKKLLIFDAYGTLISTGRGSLSATEKILTLQDKTIDAVEFYAYWKKYHRKNIDECNRNVFITEQDIFKTDLKMLYEKYGINRPYELDVSIMIDSLVGRVLFPESKKVIDSLRNQYRIVIGSTTDTEPLLANLKNNYLKVDEIYTSEMIGKYKPHRDFYEYILQREKCDVSEVVFIGDSLKDDIFGPKQLGITTVLVDRNKKYSFDEVIKPDYIVSDLYEINDLKF